MDYELNHIDEFLSDKLAMFEEMPDDSAMAGLFDKLPAAFEHPIDNALYRHLSKAEFSPELYVPLAAQHPIDTGLSNALLQLDVQPQDSWQAIAGLLPEQKKKNRKVIYWIIALLIAVVSAATYSSIQSKKSNGAMINAVAQSYQNLMPETPSIYNQNTASQKATNELTFANQTKQMSTGIARLRRFLKSMNDPNRKRLLFESIDNITGASVLEESPYLTIHPITKLFNRTIPDEISLIPVKSDSYFKKRLSPFSITLSAGAINDHTINDKISSDKVHRDAASLFSNATGKNNKGFILNLQFGYRILPRVTFKVGVNLVQTKVSPSINYTYTDIPIYDSATGAILGYYKRSVSNSTQLNETTPVTNTTINSPVQIGYQLFETNRFAVWVEGGTNINLKAKLNSDLFNFKNEKMAQAQKTKAMTFSPNMAFSIRYRYLPNLQLMAQLQLNYQQKKYYIDSYHFTKTELSPMINFGIIYHPLIRKK
ncbi:MAG: hypothetical protein V4613_11615 [Bacteroidota bacterium]